MQDDVALRDVMTREFVGVTESDSIRGAARLMCDEGTETAVVLRGQEPVGVVTPLEVLEFVASGGDPAETPVSSVMSEPSESLAPDDSLAAATAALAGGDGSDVLVAADGEVVGTLHPRDVVVASASTPATDPAATGPADRRDEPSADADRYSSQSICETCGSLTRDLVDVNGQLRCANCRDV